jgi:hypothetical protein
MEMSQVKQLVDAANAGPVVTRLPVLDGNTL